MTSRFTFATGDQAEYIEGLYQDWLKDETSVDYSWAKFFEGFDFGKGAGGSLTSEEGQNHGKVEAYINAFRRLGHLSAHLNPLAEKPALAEDMTPNYHGLENIDLEEVFQPANFGTSPMSLKEIEERLERTYCGSIGADFRDINNIEIIEWLQQKMESCENKPKLSGELRKNILEHLSKAEGFENSSRKDTWVKKDSH